MLDLIRAGHPLGDDITPEEAETILVDNINLFDSVIEKLNAAQGGTGSFTQLREAANDQFTQIKTELETLNRKAPHSSIAIALDTLNDAKAILGIDKHSDDGAG